jgi:S1-C subfamily serine protease
MNNRRFRQVVLITMIVSLLVLIIFDIRPLPLLTVSGTLAPADSVFSNESIVTESAASTSISSLYDRVEPSVVQISPQFTEFDIFRTPLPPENTAQGYGSGFVFDEQGHIVTNSHVVGAVNSTAEVTFSDGRSFVATVIGEDVFADIAVLEINQTGIPEGGFDFIPLAIANSSTIEVGEPVVAIGYPFVTSLGSKSTLSAGVISQTQRLILSDYGYQAAIQTDVDINPGNSGGPLLNINGEVVGINTAIFSPGTGAEINYAVPSDMILRVVPSLIENGGYLHPWIGIDAVTLTPEMAAAAGMPPNIRGVLLYHLVSDNPADQSGRLSGTTTDQYGNIRAGDVIVGVNSNNVTTIEDLFYYLEKEGIPFEPVVLNVNDHGVIEDVTVLVSYKIPSDVFYCMTCM